ncbi:MAG TPA: glycosyltransferase family 2 protein [Nevskiaceae bacterium]|nr:glycosyltransferase family 2 protein [Nevskiaceae bacterium]
MSSEPLVSVVLPTFNRAHSLPRAMRSVLGQSYRNLELLVVDDCSTDDSERIVAAFAANDPRVRLIRRERNGGAAAARNTGIGEARGELIAFQDSDDEWLADKLERQVMALHAAGEGTALCVSAYLVYQGANAASWLLGRRSMVYPHDLRRQALVTFFFTTPTWLARTRALRELGGFDETMRCWEDWELALRLVSRGDVTMIDDALHIQHESAGSVNRQDRAYGPAMRRILDKHEALWRTEPGALAEHCFVIGRHEILYGSPAEARRFFARAIRLRPSFRRAWLGWTLATFGRTAYALLAKLRGDLRREAAPQKANTLQYITRVHGDRLMRNPSEPPQ